MPSGQTQVVFKDEKALVPEHIRDIQRILDASLPDVKIQNYKIVSGLLFFEIMCIRPVKRLGRMSLVRHFLVVGEDPRQKGCVATMHLSDEKRRLITTHMKGLEDTRGGIANLAWCSALQLTRKIFPSGTISRSYYAIRNARRDYCKELLILFDDSVSFKDQDWQAVQNVVNGRQELLRDNRNNPRRPGGTVDSESENEDDSHNQNDDSDPDSADELAHWTSNRPRMPTFRRPDSELENNEDDPLDIDEELADIGGTQNIDDDTADFDEHMSNRYDDRSPSLVPFLGSRWRQTSPKFTAPAASQSTSSNNTSDSHVDVNLPTAATSSVQPKVEHASPEPGTAATTQIDHTRPGNINNPIDITEDYDQTFIDLTGDAEVTGNSSEIEVIELDL